MRRRGLLLALPLGAVALGSCDPNAPAPPEDLPGSGAGTESDGRPDIAVDPEPTLIGEFADPVDPTTVRLPLEMGVMIVVDPGWTAMPQVLDGIFLGYEEGGDDAGGADGEDGANGVGGADGGDRLRFTALDQDGTALWSAQRPLSCTGFALSRDADGRAVAVLTDRAADGGADPMTTATGYDLRTAETLWGPVAVPGPLVAPGLIFSAAPESDDGARIALSAGTGEVLLTDDALDEGRLLAEHSGLVLHTEGAELVARDSGDGADGADGADGTDGSDRWRLDLPEGVDASTVRVAGPIDDSRQRAVLVDGAHSGVLVDLAEGRLLAEDVSAAAYDHGLDVTVVASGRLVRGLEEDGTEAWRHEDPEELVFLTAGERLAYAQRPEEGTLVVLDTSKGEMVQPYDADLTGLLAVPELFTEDAATSVHVEDTRYLVTTRLDEEYGMRG
ncbi:MAG: hypothetical protein ACTIOA_11590 [Brachybacterium tyrofermentans]|uniref:hypothetical protein n=1 Tax=Brachybacterium TaxID=43668 RepID=UPI003F8F822D